jgi:hypothetical protein
MKATRTLFPLVGVLCLILTGLAFLFSDRSSTGFASQMAYQKEPVEDLVSQSFTSVESESEYRLTYRWEDFDQKEIEFSFTVLKDVLKEAENEFGYYPDDLDQYVFDSLEPQRKEMIVHLKGFTQKLINRSKHSDFFFIEDDKQDRFHLKLSAPPSLYEEVKAEFERIKEAMGREQAKFLSKIEKASQLYRKEFIETRGLRYLGSGIGVDYGHVAENNRLRVEGILRSLQNSAEGKNLHQFISLLLSFIQEIRYGIPPLYEDGKYILGFWVPPKVLATNFGDCDSKSVTFASMWQSYKKYPLLLLKIPDHMFVGLAIPSFSGEGIVINGLRYTLCEVAGPDKIPMGLITPYSWMHFQGGNYTYELIK